VELRRELEAVAADPSMVSASRVAEFRGRLVREYAGRPGAGEAALFDRSDAGPGREMAALLADLGALARNPKGRLDDIPRIADVIDRALATPPADVSVHTVMPLIPADSR
jgi:hypothetical protein